VEVQLPTPEPAGRDLLVQVKAVSVNPVDVKVRRRTAGEYAEPRILGWDAAGVVQAWVTRFRCLRSAMKCTMPATSLARM